MQKWSKCWVCDGAPVAHLPRTETNPSLVKPGVKRWPILTLDSRHLGYVMKGEGERQCIFKLEMKT